MQYTIKKLILKKYPRKSGQFYIMQALLTNPCMQTVQQIVKVGLATKVILLMK